MTTPTMTSDTVILTVPTLPPMPSWADDCTSYKIDVWDDLSVIWSRTLPSDVGPVTVEQSVRQLSDGHFTISPAYVDLDGGWELTTEDCHAFAATLAQAAVIVRQADDAARAFVTEGGL